MAVAAAVRREQPRLAADGRGGRGGRGGQDASGAGADTPAAFQNQLNKFLKMKAWPSWCAWAAARAAAERSSDKPPVRAMLKDAVPPPTVALTPEHYNRVLRLLDNKIPVKLEFDIQAKFLRRPHGFGQRHR